MLLLQFYIQIFCSDWDQEIQEETGRKSFKTYWHQRNGWFCFQVKFISSPISETYLRPCQRPVIKLLRIVPNYASIIKRILANWLTFICPEICKFEICEIRKRSLCINSSIIDVWHDLSYAFVFISLFKIEIKALTWCIEPEL